MGSSQSQNWGHLICMVVPTPNVGYWLVKNSWKLALKEGRLPAPKLASFAYTRRVVSQLGGWGILRYFLLALLSWSVSKLIYIKLYNGFLSVHLQTNVHQYIFSPCYLMASIFMMCHEVCLVLNSDYCAPLLSSVKLNISSNTMAFYQFICKPMYTSTLWTTVLRIYHYSERIIHQPWIK